MKFYVRYELFVSLFIQFIFNILIAQNSNVMKLEKFIPQNYNSMLETFKQKTSPEIYESYVQKYNNMTDIECFRVCYTSDGLKVFGFLIKPKDLDSKKLPLVIYNRGGYEEDGKIDVITLIDHLYFLAQNGYVVVASQYRGSDGGEGKDECGGSEINDVLNLAKIAQTLDYVDPKNIFMLGFSRGGIMSYLAFKNGLQVNAAAIIAGITDMFMLAKMRPELEVEMTKWLPDLLKNKDKFYFDRSVMEWPKVVDTPLLLLHNKDDQIVSVEQSIALATVLKDSNKPYELVIYEDNRHILDKYREDAQKKILEWLEKYKIKYC